MAKFVIIDEYRVDKNGAQDTSAANARAYNIDNIQTITVDGYGNSWYINVVPVGGRAFRVATGTGKFATKAAAIAARNSFITAINS